MSVCVCMYIYIYTYILYIYIYAHINTKHNVSVCMRSDSIPCSTRLTYLLTLWCRVLLEKLTGLQLVKKIPAFHGTGRFITALTSVRHPSLSWASPIQSIYPHPTSWRSILILSTPLLLGLPSGLLPSVFPTKTLYTPSPHPYAPHAQPITLFHMPTTNISIHYKHQTERLYIYIYLLSIINNTTYSCLSVNTTKNVCTY